MVASNYTNRRGPCSVLCNQERPSRNSAKGFSNLSICRGGKGDHRLDVCNKCDVPCPAIQKLWPRQFQQDFRPYSSFMAKAHREGYELATTQTACILNMSPFHLAARYNGYKHGQAFIGLRKEGHGDLKETCYQSAVAIKLKRYLLWGCPFGSTEFPENPHGIAAMSHADIESG